MSGEQSLTPELAEMIRSLRSRVYELERRATSTGSGVLNDLDDVSVNFDTLTGGQAVIWNDTDQQFENGNGGSPNFGPHVLIEDNTPPTGLAIGKFDQLAAFDTIYTDDPDALTTSSVIPAAMGLTGYFGATFGGATGPDALPFTRLRATEPGFWLVSFACEVDGSDPTQLIAPFIEGDYMSPVTSPFLVPAGGLINNEFGVTWLTALRVDDEIVCGIERDDASAAWQGITYAAARIWRLA